MNEKHIAQLESRLERFVEGAFTNLFHKRITSHDIAIELARSITTTLRVSVDKDDVRPIAPDQYTILVSPGAHARLGEIWSELAPVLRNQIIELASLSGYRLANSPTIQLVADKQLQNTQIQVKASHSRSKDINTQAMQPISIKPGTNKPQNPQFIINGQEVVQLKQDMMNVGRSNENHIVIDDATVSRHHLQVRLRFGSYTIFDANSRAGTFINGVRVLEHRLQPGDVIQIGNTQIVYITDEAHENTSADTTQTLDPVD